MSGTITRLEGTSRRAVAPRPLFSPVARFDADDRIRRLIYGVLFYLILAFTSCSELASEIIGLPKLPYYTILIPLITWQFIKRVP